MTKTFEYTSDAIRAIREHFQNRNAARAITGRIILQKKFVEMRADGELVYEFRHQNEIVKMVKGINQTAVEF